MDIKDFKVGQAVWIELTGGAKRGRTEDELIQKWVVTSVGRKYIKAKRHPDLTREVAFEFNACRGSFVEKSNYSPDFILHSTKQEIEDKLERNRLFKEIRE